MITITKQDNGVLFTFENSDKYLYGNGTIEVPFNTLSIIADESDMITLRKSASNDIFLSARYDSDLGYRSKDDAIDDLKGMLFAEAGGGSESGITSGEVQTMIDESISGKADTAVVNQAISEATQAILSVSGDVQTKVATTDFNTYSAATDSRLAEDEEVTAAALNDLNDNKQGKLVYYEENAEENWANIDIQTDDGEGNTGEYWFNVGGGTTDLGVFSQYDDGEGNVTNSNTQINIFSDGLTITSDSNDGEDSSMIEVTPTDVTINGEAVATEPYVDAALSGKADTSAVTAAIDAAISGKVDTSAVTAAIDAATSGKVDTSAITTAITSGSTDSEIPTAKATYDAIQAGGTSVTVDPTLDTGSTNPVANSAITAALDAKISNIGKTNQTWVGQGVTSLMKYYKNNNGGASLGLYLSSINGKSIIEDYYINLNQFSLVETSAVTTAITSASTNDEVAGAKAVYDTLGGLKFVQCTQAQYDALVSGGTVQSDTVYFITNVVS